MDTTAAFGFGELFNSLIGDMAKAVCERVGETKQQQVIRSQTAVHAIMGFLPRDAIEAMLAGHCLMFHEMMTDSVRDTLRGEIDTARRATRATIVAMDKAFGNNLTRLERYRSRPAERRSDAPEVAETEATVDAPMAWAEQAPPVTAQIVAARMEVAPVPAAPRSRG